MFVDTIDILKFLILYGLIQITPYLYNFIQSRIKSKKVLRNIKDGWIIITGATDGIGKALALNFSKRNQKIIIVGRNQEKLNEVKLLIEKNGSACKTMLIDFTSNISFKNMFDEYEISLLINNVGCCTAGPKNFIEDDMIENIINVNILNTYKLTKEILKSMCNRKKGYVINIGSITGDFPVPFLSTYSSSKAMIKSWSESMNLELKPYNVHFECIDTGFVATKMSKIWKPNFFCPSPDKYAESIVTTFGSNDVSFTYFPHLIQHLLVVLTPRWLMGRISYTRQSMIKKIIERKSKK